MKPPRNVTGYKVQVWPDCCNVCRKGMVSELGVILVVACSKASDDEVDLMGICDSFERGIPEVEVPKRIAFNPCAGSPKGSLVVKPAMDYGIEIALEAGIVTQENVQKAMEMVNAGQAESIKEALIKMGITTSRKLLETIATGLGLEMVDLGATTIPPDVPTIVPVELARRYKIIPIASAGDILTIAFSNPLDVDVVDEIKYILKKDVEVVIAPEDEILAAINKHYGSQAQ